MTASLVTELLQAADALPDNLRDWLRDGFTAWQAGADLHTALCLDGPDPDRRDDLLRTVIALSPGESLTARCAFTVACLIGHEQHPRADMQSIIRSLRLINCPLSIRHMRRIMEGRRQDGWRIQEADTEASLCPVAVQRFNSGTLTKTGT